MQLLRKITDALDCLRSWSGIAGNPIVACSFGKDSMVLLHLMRQIDVACPVLFFSEDFQPDKSSFARSVISDWGLVAHSYPPVEMGINAGSGEVEIIRMQDVGEGQYIYLPVGVNTDFGSDFKCGVDFIMQGERAKCDYPWDVTFVGHRSEDVDPVYGNIRLQAESAVVGRTLMVYPLADWTTADIWQYSRLYNVPINEKRYDPQNGHKKKTDRRFNNDYYDICVRCISPYEGDTVVCPKIKQMVPNTSAEIDWEGRKQQWQLVNIQKQHANS